MQSGSEHVQKEQILILKNRCVLEINSVKDVLGFDTEGVSLHTALGGLTVEGEGLRLTRLDLENGQVTVEGKISAMLYTEEKERKGGGFFARFVK